MTIIYSIPAPYSNKITIVVYCEDGMASYEYRIEVEGTGTVLHDTKDACYGSAEIALRDALIDVTTSSDDIPPQPEHRTSEDRVQKRKDWEAFADWIAKEDPDTAADLHRILAGATSTGGDEIVDHATHTALTLALFEGGRRSWRRKGLAGTTGDACNI